MVSVCTQAVGDAGEIGQIGDLNARLVNLKNRHPGEGGPPSPILCAIPENNYLAESAQCTARRRIGVIARG